MTPSTQDARATGLVELAENNARLRSEVVAVINEMSRHMPHATEDWRARLTEALA